MLSMLQCKCGIRQYGLQLFKDEQRLRVRMLFGSLTDPAFVSERPDAAAASLIGRVAFLWAGAVLHVRASCARAIVCCFYPLMTALLVHWLNECLRQARSRCLTFAGLRPTFGMPGWQSFYTW